MNGITEVIDYNGYIPLPIGSLVSFIAYLEIDPNLWKIDPDFDMKVEFAMVDELLLDLTGNLDSGLG